MTSFGNLNVKNKNNGMQRLVTKAEFTLSDRIPVLGTYGQNNGNCGGLGTCSAKTILQGTVEGKMRGRQKKTILKRGQGLLQGYGIE